MLIVTLIEASNERVKVVVTYSRIAASSAVDTSLEVLTATLQIQIFETA